MISAKTAFKLVGTYELPEIETPDDAVFGTLKFVVQVLRDSNGRYFPRVLRKDSYNVEPAYVDEHHNDLVKKATEEIVVSDASFDWSQLESDSEEAALERAVQQLNEMFTRQA